MPAPTRQQAEDEERAATAVAREEAQGQAEQAAAAERAARDALREPQNDLAPRGGAHTLGVEGICLLRGPRRAWTRQPGRPLRWRRRWKRQLRSCRQRLLPTAVYSVGEDDKV